MRLYRCLAALLAAILLLPASAPAQPAEERFAQITSSPPAQPKRLVPTQTTASQQAALTDKANQNTVTVISGNPNGTYLYLAYDKASNLVTADWVKDNRCLEQKLVWDGSGFTSSTTTDIGDQAVCDKLWEK